MINFNKFRVALSRLRGISTRNRKLCVPFHDNIVNGLSHIHQLPFSIQIVVHYKVVSEHAQAHTHSHSHSHPHNPTQIHNYIAITLQAS